MKKPRIQLLVLVTCIFASFIGGFFAGRNLNRTPVQIRTLENTAVQSIEETCAAPTQPGIININTATAQLLESLPGIGQVIAQRIVDYREQHGPFDSVGELGNVSGIGEKRLEDIWDLVTTGG